MHLESIHIIRRNSTLHLSVKEKKEQTVKKSVTTIGVKFKESEFSRLIAWKECLSIKEKEISFFLQFATDDFYSLSMVSNKNLKRSSPHGLDQELCFKNKYINLIKSILIEAKFLILDVTGYYLKVFTIQRLLSSIIPCILFCL